MNRTALITGASRGIGRAAAELLAERGYRLMLNYFRSEGSVLELKQKLTAAGADAEIFQADVGDSRQAEAMAEACCKRFGRVDVLINNAGNADVGLLTEVTDERWDRLWRVNVGGVFYTCRAVLPGMIREKRGKIINLSSIWGIAGASCEAAYSATKAAVIGLTKALAKEVGPSGIQVNCIAPGAVETDMNAALDEAALRSLREETPLGRLGTPREIAAAIAFLASEESDFITGQVLSPNGGLVI